ncbi:hypothetical protein [Knoellia sp. p5-6-4]|uniref:hypothetical protein n=1 Tax=unclassified Knoellia TaxID=2618719 RepID=UPI0023D97A70|nr:hypothetical protein [Knoellia sp. p5-6-4]MDF2144069.1 hypothetical protein [Knoellia sp. p5-6-4]
MVNLLAYLALCGVIVATFGAAWSVLEWFATGRPPRSVRWVADRVRPRLPHRLRRRRREPEPLPPVLLGLELRRLGAEVQRIDSSDLPAKAMRLRAATAAYDYVLLEACRSLEVPLPGTASPIGTPLTQDQRLAAETSLVGAGFTW